MADEGAFTCAICHRERPLKFRREASPRCRDRASCFRAFARGWDRATLAFAAPKVRGAVLRRRRAA